MRSFSFAHPPERLVPNPKLKFLDQCREVMAFKRFSRRTVEAYLHWIKRLILWSAKRPPRVPVVLSREETWMFLERLEGTQQLIGRSLYGTGLRLLEGLRLRVK